MINTVAKIVEDLGSIPNGQYSRNDCGGPRFDSWLNREDILKFYCILFN